MKYRRERAHFLRVRPEAASVVLAALLLASSARAENAAQVEARKHFFQGVAFADQQRLPEALAEFERCYALYPSYGTLYNIAQVHAALGHAVAAVETFEKYLADGKDAIFPEQRARAEAELAAQRQRIGELTVRVSPADAQLLIDDNVIARDGAATSVRLVAGPHRVSAVLAGHRTEQRPVEVVAQRETNLQLTLEPLAPATAPPAPQPPPAVAAPAAARDWASHDRSTQQLAGFVVGGVGLVGAGVGLAIALTGQAKHRDALEQWAAGDKDTARATESSSASQKTAGYVVLGVGGAVTLTGAVLALTARAPASSTARALSPRRTAFRWSPWLSPSLLGASFEKAW